MAKVAHPVTVNAGLDNDTINVGNGNLDNLQGAITVDGQGGVDKVNVNDQTAPFSDTYTITSTTLKRPPLFGGLTYSGIEGLTLNAETGNNTININSTAAGVPVTVNAGLGNDTINVGNGNLDNLPGAVTVNGQGGVDTVNVNDQTAPFSDTYTITSTTLSRIIFGGLSYSGIEGLTLNAETGNNTININSTAAGVPVTVNAGLGNDTINVGNGNLDNLPGAVTVNGQGGVDTVNVNDDKAPFSDTYTITSTTLSRIIFGGLSYSGIEGLTLNAETGNNTININSTAAGVPVTVNAGLGNDTINVGNGNLDNLPGAVTVNGQGGIDTVNVNDQTASFSDTYTITSTTLSRIIFGGLTYSGIEGLTLNAETGDNTININSTAFGVPVTVNAGLGNDTINVGNGNLDNLPGAVTVNGQGGVDKVNVNDDKASFSDTYTITSTTLSRIIFGGLTYSGIEGLTLNAETGNNTININSTAFGVPVTVNAGPGNDTINVGNGNLDNLPGAVTVNGQGGVDTVNVNDDKASFSDTYTITSTTLSRIIFGGLTYSGIEGLTLNAETGNNTININSTAFGVPVTVNAGPGNDTINVGNGNLDNLPGAVTVNGQGGVDKVNVNDDKASFSDTYTITSTTLSRIIFGGLSYSGIEGLTLNAETGNNTININSTAFGVPVTVNAGPGNDTINVGTGNLDNLPGAVTVNGQGGVDKVNVNDDKASFSDTYTITSTTLSRIIFGGLSYSGIEGLTLNAETGNNTININSTAFGVPVTVNAGPGNDTINVGNGNLDNLPGAVTVNGQGGVDKVNVNDDKAPFSDTYTITSTTLSRIIFGGLSYSGIEGLTLNAETGNNTININSTAFGVPVTVNAGPGNDTINVGNGNLDNLPGAVTVNGQGGVDKVNVNDDKAPFSDTYTITSTTLSRIIFGGLSYSGIEGLTLNAETGNNTININSTAFGVPVTVNAGPGNDTINVGNGNLDNLPGAVTVNGQGGVDKVNVNDDKAPFSDTYTITSTTLSRIIFGGLSYSGIEGLTLNAETGNNTININSTAFGVPVTVNAAPATTRSMSVMATWITSRVPSPSTARGASTR